MRPAVFTRILLHTVHLVGVQWRSVHRTAPLAAARPVRLEHRAVIVHLVAPGAVQPTPLVSVLMRLELLPDVVPLAAVIASENAQPKATMPENEQCAVATMPETPPIVQQLSFIGRSCERS